MLTSSEKHHVDVYAQPDVVGQVPTGMVRIFVQNYLVSAPKPVIAEAIIWLGDTEIEAAKPETIPAPSLDPEGMTRAKASRKVSMLPGTIEVVLGIIGAGIVPDPLTVRVNVGSVGMSGLVVVDAILWRVGLWSSGGSRRIILWMAGLLNSSRGRPARRNIPATNTLAATLTLRAAASRRAAFLLALRKSTDRKH